uniref:Uncharacterized protein n=1 Tax=Anopheles culicifacies TaxID=139723 RepID=A0A182MW46_9DIPT
MENVTSRSSGRKTVYTVCPQHQRDVTPGEIDSCRLSTSSTPPPASCLGAAAACEWMLANHERIAKPRLTQNAPGVGILHIEISQHKMCSHFWRDNRIQKRALNEAE